MSCLDVLNTEIRTGLFRFDAQVLKARLLVRILLSRRDRDPLTSVLSVCGSLLGFLSGRRRAHYIWLPVWVMDRRQVSQLTSLIILVDCIPVVPLGLFGRCGSPHAVDLR